MVDHSPSSSPLSLRLLMVTPRYLPEMGGVENHVFQVATRLAQKGVQVSVLTTDRSGKLPASEIKDGVQIIRERAWPTHADFYYSPGIDRYIRHGSWDIVHIQSYHTLVAPIAMQAARTVNLPYILTFHGGGHSSRIRNTLRGTQLKLLRPLLSHARRLVALAQFEQAFYIQKLHLPADQFALIPNGSDLPVVGQKIPSNGETLIASVGRLERYKGHQRILAAMPFILARRPDTWLWIAGTGPYESTLRSLAKKLGVEDHVRFQTIPTEERASMAEQLSKTNLAVLLSDYETQPLAVLEALALGVPALVSDTSGLRELSDRGLAKSIPLNSSALQVAAAVMEQLSNPLILKKINLPSWDDCASGLFNLYQEVLQVAR